MAERNSAVQTDDGTIDLCINRVRAARNAGASAEETVERLSSFFTNEQIFLAWKACEVLDGR